MDAPFPAPAIALMYLEGLAGSWTTTLLDRIAGSPNAPDLTRLLARARAMREHNSNAVLVLYALLHCGERTTQLAAIAHVRNVRPIGAAAALDRLARTTPDPEVRQAAQDALQDRHAPAAPRAAGDPSRNCRRSYGRG